MRLFKTLLLWLVMAALPIQGMAAVIGTSCAPVEHAALSMVSPMEMHNVSMTMHHHDDGESAMAAAHHVHDGDGASTSDHATSGKHKHSTCSVCASCVSAVAPPPVSVAVPMHDDSRLVLLPPLLPATGFVPAGLERPPKRFLA